MRAWIFLLKPPGKIEDSLEKKGSPLRDGEDSCKYLEIRMPRWGQIPGEKGLSYEYLKKRVCKTVQRSRKDYYGNSKSFQPASW